MMIMKKSLLLILLPLLFAVSSCYQKEPFDYSKYYQGPIDDDDPEVEIPDGLVIMSSNVRYYQGTVKGQDTGDRAWEKRRTGYYKMVNTLKPTIMGVQEAEMNQVQDIIDNCPGYAYKGVGRTDGATKGESTSIFYKEKEISIEKWGTVWLSDTPDVPGSKFAEDDGPRTATWAVVKYTKEGKEHEYFHLNTHTSLVAASQTKEVQVMLNTIDQYNTDDLPVILTADWNLEENDPILEPITDRYYSARKMAKVSDNQKTFSAWDNVSKQLDHIFFEGMGRCLQFVRVPAKWDGINISDHYPVYTTIEFPTQQDTIPRPLADFTCPEIITMDEEIQFEDKTATSIRIDAWKWDIAGIESEETNPKVTFRTYGDSLKVSLSVMDSLGRWSSVSKKINVLMSTGHDLSIAWQTAEYDTTGFVYWTSPATNAAGDRIYVASTGNHLCCFDASGSQKGSFNIGMYEPYMTSDINRQMATPSVDNAGNVYIPVQYGYSSDPDIGNGGLFALEPECAGMRWYFPTGYQSQYAFDIPAIFGDYTCILLKNNDPSLHDGQLTKNCAIINRSTGELVQCLECDQGSYGGIAVTYGGALIYGAARGSNTNDGAGFKVGVVDGSFGTWKTSANSSAGRNTNLLGGRDSEGVGYQTKGCQPAISTDKTAYVCLTSNGGNMVVARYDIEKYVYGSKLNPMWRQEYDATVAQNGHGIALDEEGNAYVQAGDKVVRLNASDGSIAWTFETQTGNCGMPAVDNLGYVYVNDFHGHIMYKLSPTDGKIISSIKISGPRSCPTIAPDGSIYVNASGPKLYKVTCPKTTAPGANWSQVGGNPQKTCTPPGAVF